MARVFLDNEECIASTTSTKGINQPYLLSALVYGSAFSEQWGVNERDVDFFDMKKIFENTILSTKLEFQNSYNLDFLHPGRSAMVVDPDYKKDRYNPFNLINENVLGFIGEIHPIISSSLNISKPPIVFEIYVSSLIDKTLPKHSMIPRVPSVRRDLAFVVPKQINAGSIEKYVLKNKNQFEFGEILKQFSLFDVYTGSGLNETQKSLAFMVLMQDTEKTLEDKLVQSLIEEIVKIVTANFPAELRS